ncbi:rop guanine nucleotide exchange factor 14 [Dorcoceras hygrometricum]|uniref:Rop guanine nucleotide exchange factor 14 n=1 Tax=Dorcoceras hygrometricum TaxID=472368 RepID=A0A2Z7AFC8_9LAMI|nr:rop guanine nucleotide exchange factor 14 [Dorcoceras hygrometricum]
MKVKTKLSALEFILLQFIPGVMTYDGLESCILNSHPYNDESGTSITDSLEEDNTSCSSSNNASGSFSSLSTNMKKDKNDQYQEAWNICTSPRHSFVKEKPDCSNRFSDVETMKEKFAKLLLGEDATGGTKGVTAALALSHAIKSLAASVFGELWKLEPLAEERKSEWRREMDWLLSPTHYMIELVPAKQTSIDGGTVEIMTPKARGDVHMNLPALQKLDSMLTETLDSMVDTEFWYSELGSQAEETSKSFGQSKRSWLSSPKVPSSGLSDMERKRLLHQGRLVYQVFKAAKSINENVLAEMPVPAVIKEALHKSGKASLGDEMYKILSVDSISMEEMINQLNLKSEHLALEAANRLEAAIFAWKDKIIEHSRAKSPARTSWSFVKDPLSELDKMESLLYKAEVLLQHIKLRFPNLPHTFLDVTKIQYSKDVGCAILEAYSHVLANLAFNIIMRIGDVLQEDVTSNPNSPVAMSRLVGDRVPGVVDSPMLDRVRDCLFNKIDHFSDQYGDTIVGGAMNVTPS